MTEKKNLYYVNEGFIKLVDFVTVNKKGEKSINKKYKFILENIVIKALSLCDIGCMFEIPREYKYDTVLLQNHSKCGVSNYGKNNNEIDKKTLENVLNMVNLFLNDRQLNCSYNAKNNLIIKIVKVDAKLKSPYKRQKNACIQEKLPVYDIDSDSVIDEVIRERKGVALFNDDDIKQVWNNFLACDDVIKGFTSNFKTLDELKQEKENKKVKTA